MIRGNELFINDVFCLCLTFSLSYKYSAVKKIQINWNIVPVILSLNVCTNSASLQETAGLRVI